MENKKADFTMGAVAWIVIILAGLILLIVILGKFNVGAEFFYAGCEGNMEGVKLFDTSTNIQLGTLNSRCTIYDNAGKASCENSYPKVYLRDYGNVPFCIWIEGREIGIGAEAAQELGLTYLTYQLSAGINPSKCASNENCFDINKNGFEDKCVVNGLTKCDTLSEARDPKCSTVPRCVPVNIIDNLIAGLRK